MQFHCRGVASSEQAGSKTPLSLPTQIGAISCGEVGEPSSTPVAQDKQGLRLGRLAQGVVLVRKLALTVSRMGRRRSPRVPQTMEKSGGIGDRFIDQQNRNIVANWVDASTLRALQAFSSFLEQQRFLAHRANQDVEQVLRNHGSILRLGERMRMPGCTGADARACAPTPAPHW